VNFQAACGRKSVLRVPWQWSRTAASTIFCAGFALCRALRGELLELWTAGDIPTKAILLVTHNIEEAVTLADRIVVMGKEPGHVVADLPVDLPQPRHRKSQDFIAKTDLISHTGRADRA
jgi:ABC-type nitrate/sulfonate/bicarbonate transport system ATPase subunit